MGEGRTPERLWVFASGRFVVPCVALSDIDLPWWIVPVALVFNAPGTTLVCAVVSLALALIIGKRRMLSRGRLAAISAAATVFGAILLPIVGLVAMDGGPLRVLGVAFVAVLGTVFLFITVG